MGRADTALKTQTGKRSMMMLCSGHGADGLDRKKAARLLAVQLAGQPRTSEMQIVVRLPDWAAKADLAPASGAELVCIERRGGVCLLNAGRLLLLPAANLRFSPLCLSSLPVHASPYQHRRVGYTSRDGGFLLLGDYLVWPASLSPPRPCFHNGPGTGIG